MMSTYSLVLLSCIIFLLQSSFLPFLFNGIMQPDLWLTVIALAAVIVDRKSAFILAGVGGFLQDIVTSNFFGLHLLPYLVITLLFVKFGRHRYNKHWYVSLLSVLLASVIYVVFFQYHHGLGREPVSIPLLFHLPGHSPGPDERGLQPDSA